MNVIQVGMGGMGDAWINAINRSADVQFSGFVETIKGVDDNQSKCNFLHIITYYQLIILMSNIRKFLRV